MTDRQAIERLLSEAPTQIIMKDGVVIAFKMANGEIITLPSTALIS